MRARIIPEISCYVDNQPGMLAEMTRLFSQKQISIKGIQVYEGQLQSLVMLVVDKPEAAEVILRTMGIDLISETDILEVMIPNQVGGLEEIAVLFGKEGLNIKSVYSTDGPGEIGVAYIKVDHVDIGCDLINALGDIERVHRSLKSHPEHQSTPSPSSQSKS